MPRKHAPIWNAMLVFGLIGGAAVVLGSMYRWSDFLSCYLPIILFVVGAVLMGIQDAIDKYGPAWRETENGKSVLTETREVPEIVDGEVIGETEYTLPQIERGG